MKLEFQGLNISGNKMTVFVEAPDIIKENRDKDIDFNLVIKRIVLDVLNKHRGKSSSNVHINITEFNKSNNKISYFIAGEKGRPLYEITLVVHNKDLKKIINAIAKKNIIQKDLSKEIGPETIAERFLSSAKKCGFLSSAKRVIGELFTKIRESFRFIDFLWEAITNQSAKNLKRDLTILSDICGSPFTEKVTLPQALKYMTELLDREQGEKVDPRVHSRVKDASKMAEDLTELRNSFKDKGFKKIVNRIENSIIKLDDQKLLLPVGYKVQGQLVEMLLEISKQKNGQYTVTLISASSETRTLFDREVGLETGSQSLRREISNVSKENLLSAVSTWIELQTSPSCLRAQGSNEWQRLFLQSLRFDKSTVNVGKISETYKTDRSSGHLSEAIFYVRDEQATPEQAKRFELAAQLRFFLDVCKNKKGYRDKELWTLIRTTALQLAHLIEAHKSSIGQKTQGRELTKVYTELQGVLDDLQSTLPELVDLRKKTTQLFMAPLEVIVEPPTPLLFPLAREPNLYPKVNPPFQPLNVNNPFDSIRSWGARCRELIDQNPMIAAQEAKLMVRMLPPPGDPFWESLDALTAQKVISDLATMGEAVARQAYGKSPASLNDIATLVALNYYGFELLKKNEQIQTQTMGNKILSTLKKAQQTPTTTKMGVSIYKPLLINAQKALRDLQRARLPQIDIQWLNKFEQFDPGEIDTSKTSDLVGFLKENKKLPEELQQLVNLNQFTSIGLGAKTIDFTIPLPKNPLVFNLSTDLTLSLEANNEWHASLNPNYKTPLHLVAPEYAADISQEVSNRYLSEYCCLGCIRDNCPNYNKVDKKDHRFHPLYMLHNFGDLFSESLIKRGTLHRDEVLDLMYTQQTNQNAYYLWTNTHHSKHGFAIADGFNQDDIRIQLMNTLTLFFDHPHFFKHPDLRWQFEIKLFNNGALSKLLDPKTFSENKPFLMSVLKTLKKEIKVSAAVGDLDSAAYLSFVLGEFQEIIKNSALELSEKDALHSLIAIDVDEMLFKYSQELIGKSDDFSQERQKTVLSLLLNNYYKKFCANPEDPCFTNDKDLEMILAAMGRLEGLERGKEKIDPEVRDKYLALRSGIVPHIQARIKRDKVQGDFVNKILFYLNPNVAALQLQWDPTEFPTVLAMDDSETFYQFDLFTGQMNYGKMRLDVIPENIKKNAQLQNLFGAALDDNWKVFGTSKIQGESGLIAYTNEKFPTMRIIVKKSETATRPKVFIEKIIKNAKGKNEWISYIHFDGQERCLSGGDVSDISDIPFAVAALIGNRQCWVDRQKKLIYVFEPGKKEPFAHIKLKTDKGIPPLTIIGDVHLLEEDTHLLSPTSKTLENFSTIEDPKFILATGKKGKVTSLNYFRYELATTKTPLIYDLEKKEIGLKAFPGYHLERYGVRPGSQDPAYGVQPLPLSFDGFHLLKRNGDEKVLIPLRPFEQQFNKEGAPLPLTKPIFPKDTAKCPVFEYSLDPETNRLVAKSSDAYAYLAYLSLAHWDYESAIYYLNKARTSDGYNENYDQIFDWVKAVEDNSPNGTALKLHFGLFHERVLEDRRIHNMNRGKLATAEGIQFSHIPRLTKIADSYAHYVTSIKSRKIGEAGHDPLLDLSTDEEQYVQKLIKELLKEHGEQNIHREEAQSLRAEEVPLQRFLRSDSHDPLGISGAANLIWMFKGNDKGQPTLTFKEPKWVLKNFRDLFNRLLELDPQSGQFNKLEFQIRMLSELSLDNLSLTERDAIERAQYYLLKLIALRQAPANSLDPTFLDTFKEMLGTDGKLPKITGPLFLSSRRKYLEKMKEVISEDHFDKFSRVVPERALAKCASIPKKLRKPSTKFIKKWIAAKKPQAEFKEAFKNFLMKEVYGTSSTQSLQLLSRVFNILDTLSIVQPKQKMLLKPAAPLKPIETYQQKYGPLIASLAPDYSQSEALVKDIAAQPEPAAPKKIETPIDKATFVLGSANVKRFERFFSVEKYTTGDIPETVFDELSQSTEKAFVRLAEDNRRDLHAFMRDHKKVTIDKEDALELQKELQKEVSHIEVEKEKLKKDLLQFAERFHTPAGIIAMRRLTGKGVKPTLDFLIQLWRRGEINKPWDAHLFKKAGMRDISEKSLKQLDRNISHYLEVDTKYEHLKRTLAQNQAFISSFKEKGEGDLQLAEGVYDALATKRHFTLDDQESPDFRDLLYIEYTQDILLRKSQVATFRDMLSDPNAVRQLGMGGGKSKVILPLLAKKKATGKNLVMLMLPEELYETNCRDLDQTNRQLFGQEMYRFDFTRTSDRSEGALHLLYVRMLKTVKDKGFMMTTKRSMLSFRNAYLETLSKLAAIPKDDPLGERPNLIAQLKGMSKILSLFIEKTDVISDEVDACLDVRKEVNFSLGDSRPVEQVKADVGAELMSLILNAQADSPLAALAAVLRTNSQATLSPEQRTKLMAHLAGDYYDKHQNRLTAISKPAFVNYMMNGKNAEATEKWVFSLKDSNNPLFKEITTVKAFLDRGFGTTLGRVGNVNYGRDPVSGLWTIPYKASNTPHVGSEFEDEIEQISYTIQDYLQNGVTYKQVYRIVARIRQKAIDEMRLSKTDEFMSINDTEGGREFAALIREVDPDQKLGQNVNLATVYTPKNIEALVAAINSSSNGCLAFCHKQVIGRIRQYPIQINSLSADVTSMVKNFGGFTGTPWNLHTYDDKIHAEKNLGVDGTTWALMLGRATEVHSFAFDAQNPIDSLLTNLDVIGNYQAVIDTGAYLRGTSNKEFIDRSLEISSEKGSPVASGIYFDESGTIVKKVPGDEPPLSIDIASFTELMNNLTLYDQAHTVGADIKQGRHAKAVVTIGENTFIRDLFQAVWRLRQIDKEQRVVIAVSDAIKERILNGQQRELTIEDILKFCLMNEARREAEDNFRAEKEKIQGFTKRAMLPQIVAVVESNATDDTILSLAQEFASGKEGLFLKTKVEEDSYDQYGKLKVEETPSAILERYKISETEKFANAQERLQKITQKPVDQGIRALAKEKVTDRPQAPEDWFPNLVECLAHGGSEVEQEAQAEVATELALTLETETEEETLVVTETIIPMVKTGEAAHGDVLPVDLEILSKTTKEGKCPAKSVPFGTQYGDVIPVIDYYQDVPGLLRELTDSLEFFDEGIFCSAVFERNLALTKSQLTPQCAFYSTRKPVKNVLITKSSGRWTMIIPTVHEAHKSCRQFIAEADKETEAVEVALSSKKPTILYKTGEERSDTLPFTKKEDQDQFYRLYVQAKLFNGEIEFATAEEKEALKKWLTSKDPKKFKAYFEDNILSAKPRRFADAYAKSSLNQVFNELIAA